MSKPRCSIGCRPQWKYCFDLGGDGGDDGMVVVYCGGCGCGMVGGNNFNLLKTARNLALDIMVPVPVGGGWWLSCVVLVW